MIDDTGPVLDWLEKLFAFLREWFTALVGKVETAVANVEHDIDLLFWKLLIALVVVAVIHGLITRPRKGP